MKSIQMTSLDQDAIDPQNLSRWFDHLDRLLSELAGVWKPQPFKQRRPAWCDEYPQLAEALLALDDARYQQLFEDAEALQSFLAEYISGYSALRTLTCFK